MIARAWVTVAVVLVLGHSSLAGDGKYSAKVEAGTDGRPVLSLKNEYRFPITGFVATVNPGGRQSHRKDEIQIFFDIYVNYWVEKPVVPGGVIRVPLFSYEKTPIDDLAPVVKAVIFSDGASDGEPAWLHRMALRRAQLLRQLDLALKTVANARATGKEPAALASELEDIHRGLEKASPQQGRDEQYVNSRVLRFVVRNLRGGMLVDGSARPGDKHYLFLGRLLEEWRDYAQLALPSKASDEAPEHAVMAK